MLGPMLGPCTLWPTIALRKAFPQGLWFGDGTSEAAGFDVPGLASQAVAVRLRAQSTQDGMSWYIMELLETA